MPFTAEPLPPYTYVPGKSPHPISDPAGHDFGKSGPEVEEFIADRWRDCYVYVRGIDLFHAGFYWEAHEQWEAVWIALGRQGPVADVLKSLIKLAAAGVKSLEGRPTGVERHARRAVALLTEAASRSGVGAACCGIRLADARDLAGELVRQGWKPIRLPLESEPT